MSKDGYSKLLSHHVTALAKRVANPEDPKFIQAFRNFLTDGDGPKVAGITLTEKDKFLYDLLRAFMEITASMDALSDIAIYMSRFPFTRNGISRDRYLSYHYTVYLNEIYLLRSRLTKHLRELKKFYRNNGANETGNSAILQKTIDVIEDMFRPLTNRRSHHVHTSRYEDEDVQRLRTVDFINSHGEKIFPDTVVRGLTRVAQQKLLNEVRLTETITKQVLDVFFDVLQHTVFNDSGDIVYPKDLKLKSGRGRQTSH